jgi:hypothetical protein
MSVDSRIEVQVLADDVGIDVARLRGLQAQVEVLGCLNAFVAENAPDKFLQAGA